LQKHTDREYENELETLRERVLLMGATVEQLIGAALDAFERRDVALAQRAIENDDQIDHLEVDIDRLCLRILALRQPVASDLRFIAMSLKVVTDLERSGDLAVNVSERVVELGSFPSMPAHDIICRMGSLAQGMLRDALDAFVNGDALKAQAVTERDNSVDALYEQLFPELGAIMRTDPESVDSASRLQSIGKYVERLADHATNIAEMVVFMVRGQDVRHGFEVAHAGRR
jgi:phosphate transport system protein